MTRFQDLARYLDLDFSPDYWYDDAIDRAQEMIVGFSHADWETLKEHWRERPLEWQCRCADVLYTAENTLQALPLLIDMVRSPNDRVVWHAANSLNSLATSGVKVMVGTEVVERLRTLAQQRSGAEADFYIEVLHRLETVN